MQKAKRNLTKKQREWVLERDKWQCMFHTHVRGKGLVRCPNTDRLEVHHIRPHRFLAYKYKEVIETPYNLITLCRTHHHFIHPDMRDALRNYHKNQNAIEEMMKRRDDLVMQQIPYWVTKWDELLKHLAREATNEFRKDWIS